MLVCKASNQYSLSGMPCHPLLLLSFCAAAWQVPVHPHLLLLTVTVATCRLMVAFNTSSGIPTTFVSLRDAEGRRNSGTSDTQTNQAEAGTISMEFTTVGRLLGELGLPLLAAQH
jgi:hypothetical protein